MKELLINYPTIISTDTIGHVTKVEIITATSKEALELTVNGSKIHVIMPDEETQDKMYKRIRKIIMKRLDNKQLYDKIEEQQY